MRRRKVVALAGATAWPRSARAQRLTTPVVGFLSSRSREESERLVRAFVARLREGGPESRNVVVSYRWAEGRLDRLPALTAELAGGSVAVLVAAGGL